MVGKIKPKTTVLYRCSIALHLTIALHNLHLTGWVRHGHISRRDVHVAACDMAWSNVM